MSKIKVTEMIDVAIDWSDAPTDWRARKAPGDLYEDLNVKMADGTVVDLGEYANAVAGKNPWFENGDDGVAFEKWLKVRNGVIRNVQREVLKEIGSAFAKSPWVPTCSNSGKGCCCSPHFIVRHSDFRGRSGHMKGTVVVSMSA
jgi:hypothetical protein